MLQTFVPGGRKVGVVTRWKAARPLVVKTLLHKDGGAIPPEMCIQNHVQCAEIHHGLCVNSDAEVYETTKVWARHIEGTFRRSGELLPSCSCDGEDGREAVE